MRPVRRHRRAARQSAWRARQRGGEACYTVIIGANVIDLLVRLGLRQSANRRALGSARSYSPASKT